MWLPPSFALWGWPYTQGASRAEPARWCCAPCGAGFALHHWHSSCRHGAIHYLPNCSVVVRKGVKLRSLSRTGPKRTVPVRIETRWASTPALAAFHLSAKGGIGGDDRWTVIMTDTRGRLRPCGLEYAGFACNDRESGAVVVGVSRAIFTSFPTLFHLP